jgi:hypothetical protein
MAKFFEAGDVLTANQMNQSVQTTTAASTDQAWVVQSGNVTQTTDANGDITVTFPTAFAANPHVVATRRSTNAAARLCHIVSVSTTQVVVRNFDETGTAQANITSVSFFYLAFGQIAA